MMVVEFGSKKMEKTEKTAGVCVGCGRARSGISALIMLLKPYKRANGLICSSLCSCVDVWARELSE